MHLCTFLYFECIFVSWNIDLPFFPINVEFVIVPSWTRNSGFVSVVVSWGGGRYRKGLPPGWHKMLLTYDSVSPQKWQVLCLLVFPRAPPFASFACEQDNRFLCVTSQSTTSTISLECRLSFANDVNRLAAVNNGPTLVNFGIRLNW
jgi:hypothetical protein